MKMECWKTTHSIKAIASLLNTKNDMKAPNIFRFKSQETQKKPQMCEISRGQNQ